MKPIPLLAAATFATLASAASAGQPALAEAQLRDLHARHLNSMIRPDSAFLDKLLAPDFRMLDRGGNWISRAEYLAQMALSLADKMQAQPPQIRQFGKVALLEGVFETSAKTPPSTRVRYTDVYQWDGTYWRLLNVQHTLLSVGMSVAARIGETPPHAPWQGQDLIGDVDAILHALNENYVRAYREADIAWYDAHLAQSYHVVNSDGSLDDRAAALMEFAKPQFATYMTSFPVAKVRIRRVGELALIDAENDFVMKDGRRGISRYIDIWHQQTGGRWLCVSAHITAHKKPTFGAHD
jgi:ketosteroid isomerase-like protein